MTSLIGLVDCNNFYVSCERVFDPRLENKPVGVLSNNDGCVIARSQELKSLGVKMGTPTFKIPPDIRSQISLKSSNYALYGDMSSRVTETLRQYCPEVEIYSIDESFLHWPGMAQREVEKRSYQIRRHVTRNTGIPVSVGYSTSRTLAKLANHVAKKNASTDGVYFLDPDALDTQRILKQWSVQNIWGVSYRLRERLAIAGINTAWELRQADPKWIRAQFSVVQEQLVYELRGVNCIETQCFEPKKNIMTSRSFGHMTGQYFDVREAIRMHAQKGAEKLRAQKGITSAVMVFIKTNKHKPEQPQYHPSIVVPLVAPTDNSRIIIKAAQAGLATIWRDGFRYMKCGCMMLNVEDKARAHGDLLMTSSEENERSERLQSTVDQLNRVMGSNTVTFGAQRKMAGWHLKRGFLSQQYTTKWDEIPEVIV